MTDNSLYLIIFILQMVVENSKTDTKMVSIFTIYSFLLSAVSERSNCCLSLLAGGEQ